MVVVRYFTTASEDEFECDMVISADNFPVLKFSCQKFELYIHLRDYVELQDFYEVLANKRKRAELYCTLTKDTKIFKGIRKLLNKKVLTISQGGARFEFDEDSRKKMLSAVSTLKARF